MKFVSKIAGLLASVFVLSAMIPQHAFAHDYAMSFLYGGTEKQYSNHVSRTDSILNTVSPDYFDIYPDGSLNSTKLDATFISNMHAKGIAVVPFISNHWDRELGVRALDNTEALTDRIAVCIYAYDLDGINVDIENVSHTHRDAYTEFVRTLRRKLPDKMITVSVAANPYGWTLGWHGSYDYAQLALYSDYLMIMCYDEHYMGGSPGPMSSATFTQKTIEYALKYTNPDKLVLGVPFFGRYWQEGEAVGGYGLTIQDIENLIANYNTTYKYHADKQSAELFLTLTSGEVMPKLWGGRILTPGNYDIWYDDTTAFRYKMKMVEQYGLHGSGSWALGQDTSGIWSVYAEYKTTATSPTPTPTTAPTPTPTTAPTATPAPTTAPTATPAPTITPEPTITPTPTETPVPTEAPTWTPKPKPTKKPTGKPSAAMVDDVIEMGWFTTSEYNGERALTRGAAIKLLMRMATMLPDKNDGAAYFNDLDGYEDRKLIDKAGAYGILKPDKSGRANPNAPITKAEFAIYVDRLFDLPDTVNFDNHIAKDVSKTLGGEKYYAITKYLEHEILDTDDNGNFHPNAQMTMEDAALIAYRLIGAGIKYTQVPKIMMPR